MKVLTSLLGSKTRKSEQPKKEKRSLGAWIAVILLIALKWKWESDLWEPKQ